MFFETLLGEIKKSDLEQPYIKPSQDYAVNNLESNIKVTTMKFNREHFFTNYKTQFGKLSQSQVDGINEIFAAIEDCDEFKCENPETIPFVAYMFATVYHETAKTMQPINEYGNSTYFENRYSYKTKVGMQLGNTEPGDGDKYHGRGYVQLTGKANYERVSEELGVNVIDNPDDVLKPEIAGTILVFGMLKGWFTGRKLSSYFRNGVFDFLGARKIINGTDKDQLIADYAKKFQKCLKC